MRCVVTGATGFVGGQVVRQPLAAGHTAVTIAREPDRAGGLRERGIDVHRGDVTDRTTLGAPMRGADGVFHIAGWYKVSVRDNRDAIRANIEGARDAAR